MANRLLSSSEMCARYRNRSEEKSLENKVNKMTKSLYSYKDTLKGEMAVLRKFKEETSRNSGWSPKSLRPDIGEDVFSNAAQMTGSPCKDNKLQRMWAYTYGGSSHNRIYKELHQVGKNVKKNLEISTQATQQEEFPRMAQEVFSVAGVIKAKSAWTGQRKAKSGNLEELNGDPEINKTASGRHNKKPFARQVSTVQLVNQAKSTWLKRSNTFINKNKAFHRSQSGSGSESGSPASLPKLAGGNSILKRNVSKVMEINKSIQAFTCTVCGLRTSEDEADEVEDDEDAGKDILNEPSNSNFSGLVVSHNGVNRAKSVLTSMLATSKAISKLENVNDDSNRPVQKEKAPKQRRAKCSCNCQNSKRTISKVSIKPRQNSKKHITHHKTMSSVSHITQKEGSAISKTTKQVAPTTSVLLKNSKASKLSTDKNENKERCSSLPEMNSQQFDRNSKERHLSLDSAKGEMSSQANNDINFNPPTTVDKERSEDIEDEVFDTHADVSQTFDSKSKESCFTSSEIRETIKPVLNDTTKINEQEDRAKLNVSNTDKYPIDDQGADNRRLETDSNISKKNDAACLSDVKLDVPGEVVIDKSGKSEESISCTQNNATSNIVVNGELRKASMASVASFVSVGRRYSNRKLVNTRRSTSVIKFANPFIRFQQERKNSVKPDHKVLKGDDVFTRIAKVLFHQVKILRRYREMQAALGKENTDKKSNDTPSSSALANRSSSNISEERGSNENGTQQQADLGSIVENGEGPSVGDGEIPSECSSGNKENNGRRRSVNWEKAITGTNMLGLFSRYTRISERKDNEKGDKDVKENTGGDDNSVENTGIENNNADMNKTSLAKNSKYLNYDENVDNYKPDSNCNTKKTYLTTEDSSRKWVDSRFQTATTSNNCINDDNAKMTQTKGNTVQNVGSLPGIYNTRQQKPSRGIPSRPNGPRTPAIYHKGIRLNNYVTPQQRYKMPPQENNRKRNLSIRWHSSIGVMVSNQPVPVQPLDITLSKDVRQRELIKMVEANHDEGEEEPVEVISAGLRSRIEEFLTSVEPFCKNNKQTFT